MSQCFQNYKHNPSHKQFQTQIRQNTCSVRKHIIFIFFSNFNAFVFWLSKFKQTNNNDINILYIIFWLHKSITIHNFSYIIIQIFRLTSLPRTRKFILKNPLHLLRERKRGNNTSVEGSGGCEMHATSSTGGGLTAVCCVFV